MFHIKRWQASRAWCDATINGGFYYITDFDINDPEKVNPSTCCKKCVQAIICTFKSVLKG